MDPFPRTPILQVRDARLTTPRSEVDGLKEFFESGPPPGPGPIPRNEPMNQSTDSRKQGRKKFFSIGKKRIGNNDPEAEQYVHGVPKRASGLVPIGGTQRDLGEGHIVIMIGSPFPPSAMRKTMKTPTLEVTPSSPIMPSQPESSPSHSRNIYFPEPTLSRLGPGQYCPSSPPYKYKVGSSLSREDSKMPVSNASSSHLMKSLPEKGSKSGATSGHLKEFPSELPVIPAHAQIFSPSDSSLDSVLPPTIPQNGSTQAVSKTEPSSVKANSLQATKRPVSLILLESHAEKVEQALARARLTRDKSLECVGTSAAERPPQTLEERLADRPAIYKNHSKISTPRSSKAISPGLGLPLTPPPSLTAISVLPIEQSTNNTQPEGPPKKRTKKTKATSVPYTLVPHSTPMPDPDLVDLEILDLERMDDSEKAFRELAGMYVQQKKLRAAGEDLQRQKVADLTAGLMAQKMENLKLMNLLRQKGVTTGEIQSVTDVAPDASPLVREASTDTLVSNEGPNLDPSRFAMLGKEAQFGLMRDFSQGSLVTPEVNSSRLTDFSTKATSARHLIQRVQMSGSMSLSMLAPSIPLPPVPNARRTTHSMIVSNSVPAPIPTARSRSLTEGNISSMPYLDSFAIEQNMRRLERECAKSQASLSMQSADSSPAISEDLFGFYETIGTRDSFAQAGNAEQFSLVIEEAVEETTETTANSLPVAEDMFNSGLCISSGLTSSVSTFQTAESSNEVNVSLMSSINVLPRSNGGLDAISDEAVISRDPNPFADPNDNARTRHTIFTTVPFIETFAASPSPRPASIDDSTWGALFMGLMRRADSRVRTSSDGDLERGEAGSITSIEM